MYQFRNAKIDDLEEILIIENQGFKPEEAATKSALIKRIEMINDTFIIAELNEKVVGYINGPVINQPFITDDLFESIDENPTTGGYVAILGLVVDQSQRNQGLAGKLLNEIEQRAKTHYRLGITLTCKEELIPFYEKYGYVNKGISSSQHGGIKWFNLMKEFKH
ncbi:GNAT family N-acetyltransferase [Staphylococcus pasteuri]|mgnify:CR=1 FL=1|uniref:GNAT family N-acetyltransferase n=1 Tax=Staphylococcus pasteuri TaxID=45972 RepID=UPI002DBE79E8|nr:GNAT family N-acetyltransferase [Staphylococcus pasteuri]MEB7434103.1 GNAT family N-acetyltransferase [Staphylococcus pasteuri]